MGEKLLRLAPSVAVKQKRLEALLQGRDAAARTAVDAALLDAQVLGSLQLSGFALTWEQVVGSRSDAAVAPEAASLRRACTAVAHDAACNRVALRAWHAAATGSASGWRQAERARPGGPPTAPPEFIEGRLELLEGWLASDGARELTPARIGALGLARLVEIAPFDDGNGRVARLAAAHLVQRAGGRPPILVAADRTRLEHALQAAFRLDTAPLSLLLEEASERALDVMLQAAAGVS
jgi:Fic/DOC family